MLVDRDALARRAMREAITATGEFVVSAEAAGEDDAIAAVASVVAGSCVGAQISHDVSVTCAVQFSGSIGACAK